MMAWCGLSWLMFLLPWISKVNCGVLQRLVQTPAQPLTSTHSYGFHWLGQFDQMFGKNNWWETETNKVSRFYTPSTSPQPSSTTQYPKVISTSHYPEVRKVVVKSDKSWPGPEVEIDSDPVQSSHESPQPNIVSVSPAVQPLVNTPVQPLVDTPVQPLVDTSVQPLADSPVQPLADTIVPDTTVQPLVHIPVEPVADTPVQPLDDTPVEPQADIPVQYLVHTPIQPLFNTPVQPLVHTPFQPIAHNPLQPQIYSPVQPLVQPPVQPQVNTPQLDYPFYPNVPQIYSPVQPPAQPPVQPQVNTPQVDYPFYPNYQPISTYPRLPYDYQMPPLTHPSHEENCYTADGELGTCTSAFRCDETYGHPGGMCYQGYDGSPRVCCVYPSQCGYNTNHRVTYFRGNDSSSSPSSCSYRVNLLPNVCQIRLDFLDFRTKPPLNGLCDPSNRLLISTGGRRATIPMKELCGTIANPEDKNPLANDVPHVYVHFDMETDQTASIPNMYEVPHLSMEMLTSVGFTPSWNIRVGQVTCDGARLQAPTGCAQYYPEPKGAIASLNLIDNQYLLDTRLTVCLAGDNSACAVRYLMNKMQVGPSKTGGLGYGLVCRDFVKFFGEKTGICGVGDGREMILPIRGPLGLSFSSDKYHIPGSDVGYNIDYEFLHSCEDNVSFFKYPATK